jgi:putative ABC transport system ATP-binding protein
MSPVAAPRSTSAIIKMAGVRFTWRGRKAFSLDIDDFSLDAGERILLIGPSGSGKSTFLSLLAGIVSPDQGRIEILDTDIAKLSRSKRDAFRADHLGIIFQMFNLLPYGSAIDNVVLPLSFSAARRTRAVEKGGARTEARRLLSSLGLDDADYASALASGLSVGQQQRVAAARALIGRPDLIIADEPTSALDRDRQEAFLNLLFAEVAAANATLIMVSHDATLGPLFDRVVHLDDIAVASRRIAS